MLIIKHNDESIMLANLYDYLCLIINNFNLFKLPISKH